MSLIIKPSTKKNVFIHCDGCIESSFSVGAIESESPVSVLKDSIVEALDNGGWLYETNGGVTNDWRLNWCLCEDCIRHAARLLVARRRADIHVEQDDDKLAVVQKAAGKVMCCGEIDEYVAANVIASVYDIAYQNGHYDSVHEYAEEQRRIADGGGK